MAVVSDTDAAGVALATPSPAARSADGRMSVWRLLLFALPNLPLNMMIMPVATIVPSLYVKERGVALATMGVVLMAARIFDAFADQIVGYLSDVTRARLNNARKWWILGGMLLAAPSVYLLFNPPAGAGIVYFTICSLAAYLAWAMLLIPYTAWGAELSRDYQERTRIAAYRGVTGQAGGLVYLAVPLGLHALGLAKTTETDLHSSLYVALILLLLLPVGILPALFGVPAGVAPPKGAPVSLKSAARSLIVNGPMKIYLGSLLIGEIGYGIFATVIFLYIDAYLGIGAKFSYIIMWSTAATLLSLPCWEIISRHIGKRASVMGSWFGQAIILMSLVLVPKGEAGFIPFTALISLSSFLIGSSVVVTPSIMGDVIDYDTLKTGGYRAGNYFALYGLVDKMVVALGGGMAFVMLGWCHYDVVHPKTNGPAANTAMLVVFAVIPSLLKFASLGLLWRYPLNAKRQSIVRRRLEQREARAARDAQLPLSNKAVT